MSVSDADRTFGRNVQRLRKGKGYTQEAFAEHVGKSVDTISKIERGVASTRIETAETFANILGVPLHTLFETGPELPLDTRRKLVIERFATLTRSKDEQTLNAIMDAIEALIAVHDRSRETD